MNVIEATSSGECCNGPARKAIDGDDAGGKYDSGRSGKCAHTVDNQKVPGWIKLDLGSSMAVASLELVGRNRNFDQSRGWTIRVGSGNGATDTLCKTSVDASGGRRVPFVCTAPVTGRYVTISSYREMVLCEAKVFGPAPATTTKPGGTGDGPAWFLANAGAPSCPPGTADVPKEDCVAAAFKAGSAEGRSGQPRSTPLEGKWAHAPRGCFVHSKQKAAGVLPHFSTGKVRGSNDFQRVCDRTGIVASSSSPLLLPLPHPTHHPPPLHTHTHTRTHAHIHTQARAHACVSIPWFGQCTALFELACLFG